MKTRDSIIRIGINACIDRLGRNFVQKYADSSSSAYGDVENGVYCFVGVNDQNRNIWDNPNIVLDSKSRFPYMASCTVDYQGVITFCECVLPTQVHVKN